jgi:hypothetical protein
MRPRFSRQSATLAYERAEPKKIDLGKRAGRGCRRGGKLRS